MDVPVVDQDNKLAVAVEKLAEAIEHFAKVAEQLGIAANLLVPKSDPWKPQGEG